MRPFKKENIQQLNQSGHKVSSIWKKIENAGFRFYCVGCNRERRLAPPAKVGSLKFNAHILITTLFFSMITFPIFHFKGPLFFLIPVGLVFEAVYRIKMRSSLVCPDCSFDPILYLVDREKATRQVEEVWRKKFEEKGFPYPEQKRKPHQGVKAPAPPTQSP